MPNDRLNDTALRILSAIASLPLRPLSEILDFGPATGAMLGQLVSFGLVRIEAGHYSLTPEGQSEFKRHFEG